MTNEKALNQFLEKKARVDALLARIQGLSDEHFNVAPEDVHYGHVGTVADVAYKLQLISDMLFSEGEHAETSISLRGA